MSDHLEDVLNQYLDWLRDNKHPVADALQPGLSQSEIDHLAAGLPFTLTDEIQTFYRWRNGLPNEGTSFIPFFSFLSLQNAVQTYYKAAYLAEYLEAMAKSDPSLDIIPVSFRPDWFPVFVLFDPDPDYRFIDCALDKSERGKVIEVTEGEIPKVTARNLTQMIDRLLASCKAGAYRITRDGEFEQQ